MATRDVSEDIYDFLDSKGYSNLVAGPLSFISSDKAVSITETAGQGPVNYLSGSLSAYNRAGVTVQVRGTRENFSEVKTRAHNIEEDLHKSSPSGLVAVMKQGSPTFFDRDEDDRPIYNIEFIASYDS